RASAVSLGRVCASVGGLRVSAALLTPSEVSACAAADATHNIEALKERLGENGVDVSVRDNQCIIAIVGRNLMMDSMVGARVFEAMRGTPMSMFSLGTSGLNLSIVCDESHADDAVRAVHAALFEAAVGV